MVVWAIGAIISPERVAEQEQFTHDSNHAGFATGLAPPQAGIKSNLLRIIAQAAECRQVKGRAQAHIAPARDACGVGRESTLALHHVQSGIGGQLPLVFDQYEPVGFGDHNDGLHQPDAGDTGQLA